MCLKNTDPDKRQETKFEVMFWHILSQRLERLKMFNSLIAHSCHRSGYGQGVSI